MFRMIKNLGSLAGNTVSAAINANPLSISTSSEPLSPQAKNALQIANTTGPCSYRIKSAIPSSQISFLVLGCAGNGGTAQKNLACLMDRLIAESKPSLKRNTSQAENIADCVAIASAPTSLHNEQLSIRLDDSSKSCVTLPALPPTPSAVPIQFGINSGDIFYDDGAPSPDDGCFNTLFYDIYDNPHRTPYLANTPFFFGLGNHDEAFYKIGELKQEVRRTLGLADLETGIARGMNLVAHTYLLNPEQAQLFYQQPTLFIESLFKWNLPTRYYSLIVDERLEIFIIDSNTYVNEYLHGKMQPLWLKARMEAATQAGRYVMLVTHHPFFTPGKRAYNSDISLYLDKEALMKAKDQFNALFRHPSPHSSRSDTPPSGNSSSTKEKKPSYNALLWATMKKQKLVFDVVIAAHDHSMSYYNNGDLIKDEDDDNYLCQIISAGGGGTLQQRRNFKDQPCMGIFQKQYGVVQVVFNPQEPGDIRFLMTTMHEDGRIDHRFEFCNSHTKPIQLFPPHCTEQEKEDILHFFTAIKSSIDKYFEFLNVRQDDYDGKFFHSNLTHGDDGVDRAHELWAYICDSRTTLQSLPAIINQVQSIMSWTSYLPPANHSLITIINDEMNLAYGVNLDQFNTAHSHTFSGSKNMASP